MPGFTAPKLLWVREHEPEVFAAVARVLLPKDYVRLQLTGEAVSDMSDAAGTLWLDVGRRALVAMRCWPRPASTRRTCRAWSRAARRAAGCAPKSRPSSGASPPGTSWPAAAGDNAAGAAGIGVVGAGRRRFLSLGTSGVLFVANDRLLPTRARAAVHAFCHCLPGTWHQMA